MALFEVTEKARQALASLSEEAKAPFIRVSAGQACGCGRIGYRMVWESQTDPADEQLPYGSIALVVDPESRPYLEGGVLDYRDDPMQSGFVIENPHVSSGCGCGGHH